MDLFYQVNIFIIPRNFNENFIITFHSNYGLYFGHITKQNNYLRSLPPGDHIIVYVTGNNSELGNWDPMAIKLEKINDTTWEMSFYFNTNESIEFKFTKGSWDTEALNDNGEVPENNKLLVNKDTTILYTVKKWKDSTNFSVQSKFKGQITGEVKYIYKMEGKGIKPRDVIVGFRLLIIQI